MSVVFLCRIIPGKSQFVRQRSVLALPQWDSNSNEQTISIPNGSGSDLDCHLNDCTREPKHAYPLLLRLKEHGFQGNIETYMSLIRGLCSWGSSNKMLDALLSELIISSKIEMGFDIPELLLEAMSRTLYIEGSSSLGRVFDALMRGYVSWGMFDKAIHMLCHTKSHHYLQTSSCNLLINHLIKQGKLDIAVAICDQMKGLGLHPNVYTYNLLLKEFCNKGKILEACDVFKEAGVNRNAYTYTILIEGLCSQKKSTQAYDFLKEWKNSGYPFNYFAYDVVIRGFCNENKVTEAEKVLDDIVYQDVKPSAYCFSALMHVYCKAGDIKKARCLHNYMLSIGVRTSCVILSSMLQRLCCMGKFMEVITYFKAYNDAGVFLDGVCYNIAINAMCKLGEVEEAVELMEEMKGKAVAVDLFHYSTLINAYFVEGEPLKALNLYIDMEYNGLEPDIVTYNILASGFARNGLLKRTLIVLDCMKVQGFTPGVTTQNKIIESFCVGRNVELAEMFLNSLEDRCPDNYFAMIDGYCKAGHTLKAHQLFYKLNKQGVLLKKKTCLNLFNSLVTKGQIKEALMLFDTLSNIGDYLGMKMYSKLMTALCKAREIKKARCVFNNWWIRTGIIPDTQMYNIMMYGYCVDNSLSNAFNLLNVMKRRDVYPDVITYTVLLDGHLECSWPKKFISSQCNYTYSKKVAMVESKVTTEMDKMKIKPDVILYTVKIDRHCKFADVEGAVQLFCEMKESGLQPDFVTYSALLSGFYKSGDVRRVEALYYIMLEDLGADEVRTLPLFKHGIIKAKENTLRALVS